MGITVRWGNPDLNTICYDFDSQWSWADLIAATKADDEMIDGLDHFNIILDMQNVTSMPALATVKPHQLASQIGVGARTGMMVLVGRNHWAEAMLQMVYRLYGGEHATGIASVEIAGTMEDAYAIIADFEGTRV